MSFVAWHTESQAPPETGSHGTGSTTYGILDPESLQIDHYAFPPGRSESSPVQVLVEHPPGNTTLSVRNQVPGLSRPGQLTRVMSPTNVQSRNDPGSRIPWVVLPVP